MAERSSISVIKWLVTIVLLVGGVMVIRYFCMESYHVSTDSMEVALHKGDYILVNKLPQKDNPGRNRVVLFTSPLLKDTTSSPLFLSRCIGMPGDTIRISNDGYRVNGRLIPHSPRSLNTYIVTQAAQEEVLAAQKKLNIPLREIKEEPFGISFNLTSFEEYQIREELSEDANIRFLKNPMDTYELVVPQKAEPTASMQQHSPPAVKPSEPKPATRPYSVTGSYSWTVGKQISSSSTRIITGCFPIMPTKRWTHVTSDSSHATISLETPGSVGTAKTGNEFLNP